MESQYSDEQVVSLVQAGDTTLFRILVDRHKERMIRIAFAQVRNFEDAKDVAQEAFVKAFKALPYFKGNSKFSTWLFRILMNQAKDSFKKKRPISNVDDTIFENQVAETGMDRGDAMALNSAIEKLPPQQKQVVVLRYLEGFSVQETADMLEVAEGTVKATTFKALERLRDLLGDKARSITHEPV